MDAIEEYFQGEYNTEKNKINEIDELVNEAIKSITICTPDNVNGWPYKLSKDSFDAKSYSFSTNVMILFVLAKFKGTIDKNSPLLPYVEWELNKNLSDQLKEVNLSDFYKLFDKKSKELADKYLKDNGLNADDLVSTSGSFGFNDPFTLSWITEIFSTVYADEDFKDTRKVVIDVSEKIFESLVENVKNEKPLLKFKNYVEKPDENNKTDNNKTTTGREASNHIFPLLRVIHLFKTLSHIASKIEEDQKKSETTLNNENKQNETTSTKSEELKKINIILKQLNTTDLLTNFQNRINQQISHFTIQNSLFDTAELVMSLEGLLLLDENRRIDENLVRKVFDILETNQKNNLNWRPLKPFVTSSQGDVLLPLSIEIANSLLRICKLLERKKQYYFHDYSVIFNNYTQWLLANISQYTSNEGVTFKGWRSEHVQEPNVIHPWETAQVLTYLMTYKSMIQERIAYKSLKKSGLIVYDKYVKKDARIDSKIWTEFYKPEVELGYENSYNDILNKFILERERGTGNPLYSMLLFGPPGTGKSTIAEQLAETLNWRLITITPSDFIKHGEADIEGRAKSIFKTLEEQKDCVILFDEIDRFILDRDSSYYLKQADFYQFMTPSMLVKFKDLSTKEKSIFVVATNYAERIDSAIKRSGRIDEKYLINTLNAKQRKNLIEEISKSKNGNIGNITKLVKKSCFLSYIELSSLVKSAIKESVSGNQLDDILIEKIKTNPPTIKLSNYKKRFQEDINVSFISDERKEEEIDSTIYPYKEFLALVYLKIENNEKIELIEQEIINRIKKIPGFKFENHFSKKTDVYKRISNLF